MAKLKYLFFIAILMCFVRPVSYGQTSHDLVIPDYQATGKFLNDDIMGDSLSTGARKDPARVYVLKRNGIYLVNTFISNPNWVLRIRAEYGTGSKPAIYAFKNDLTAAYPANILRPGADLYMKNVAMVNWPEFMPAEISLMPTVMIQAAGTGLAIEVDSCVLNGYKTGIQLPVATRKLRVTNTIFAQYGNLYNGNEGDGRPIDFRSVSTDTIFIQNCTFMDGTDRIVRHYSSTGALGNFVFDHNTCLNNFGYHGVMALGFVGSKVTITNNVFVDCLAAGNDSTDAVRLVEWVESKEKGPSGAARMCLVTCVPNDTTTWVVKNNFFSVTPPLQAWFDTHAAQGFGNIVPLTWYINKKIGADSLTAFKKETITFVKKTRDLVALGTWYNDPNGANRLKATTNFKADYDFARPQWKFYTDTLNLSYQTSAAAYTGGAAGFPAGDLNWFPTRKSAWLLTDVERTTASVPQSFELSQNYPNPFNPTTNLEYSISKSGNVVLEVFNTLGQSVARLVDEHLVPGTYKTTFDASRLSSGVYLYRLTANNFVQTRKMVLMK
ncbi:MAG: T9SS type A sorting domain-containing protein [Ignavibacteriales bacterium]|nr:T9SS type A sorting domain-containing protein [Ignavibacteriales bacterium]